MEKLRNIKSFSDQKPNLHWTIAVANLDGRAHLSVNHQGNADTGEGVSKEVQKQLHLNSKANLGGGWTSGFFTKIEVAIASIRHALMGHSLMGCIKTLAYDLEQLAYRRVSLEEEKDASLLTEAFHNPKLLVRATHYIADKNQLAIEANSVNERLKGQKVVIIRRVLHKRLIAWVLIVLLLISPGLGTAVGMCSHRLDVGVAVSAGIYALASFLLALAKWFQE